jgi:flagellar export protein FliJ
MAKRFVFSLDAVLRSRRQQRDRQRRSVAQAAAAVARAERRVGRTAALLADRSAWARGHQSAAALDTDLIRAEQFFIAHVKSALNNANVELARCTAALESERTELADLSRRFKAIEKLRDRQWLAWDVVQKRHERAGQDEVALQQYARLHRAEEGSA